MDRPALLAVPTLCIAVVVVVTRSLLAFDAFTGAFDIATLSVLSQFVWSAVAILGLPVVGGVYARTEASPSTSVFGVAALSAFVGILVGNAVVWGVGDVSWGTESPVSQAALTGLRAVFDTAMFGLFVVGGYALSGDAATA